jgi:hypothetical protein
MLGFTRKVIEAAQIVGATLTGLYMNPTLLNQEWDVVIVDEGSMAPPPAVLVAANRARASDRRRRSLPARTRLYNQRPECATLATRSG